MKVSDYDTYIVQYGKVYLVAVAYEDTKMCRLSNSPYDALTFDDVYDAKRVAGITRGSVASFNPITGRVVSNAQAV